MKQLIFVLILGSFFFSETALADGASNSPSLSPQEFEKAMIDADNDYKSSLSEQIDAKPQNNESIKLANLKHELKPQDIEKISPLEELASQVETLKNKLAVERSTLLATQTAHKVKLQGAKTIFEYREEAIYEVLTAVDHITDIELKPGEEITTPPTAGDTVRWNIAVMRSGSGSDARNHVIIKPLDDRVETNLIISTDHHIYRLKIKSGDFCMPAVSWNYPEDNIARIQESLKREKSQEPTVQPEDLRFTYDIDPEDDYSWTPVRVFDDGKKTFIQMPHEMRVTEAPALFLLEEESEPMLVNYRVKGDYYIVDRLFERAELRVGPNQKVEIELGKRKNLLQRIFF